MSTDTATSPLPDPYADPAAHLAARAQRLHEAHTDMAGAFLHSAAPAIRALWPPAERVIFDRTAHDADPRHPVTFLHIEGAYGAVLATHEEADALDRDGQALLRDALAEFCAAVLHWDAGAVPGDRPWCVHSDYRYTLRPDLFRVTVTGPARRHLGGPCFS